MLVGGHAPPPSGASRVALVSCVNVPLPLPRRIQGPDRSCFQPPRRGSVGASLTAAFPSILVGRLPHYSFRGLLGIHSRYGPLTRGIAKRSFPSQASTASLPPPPLGLLPAGATSCRAGLTPAENQHLCTTHKIAKIAPRAPLRESGPRYPRMRSAQRYFAGGGMSRPWGSWTGA